MYLYAGNIDREEGGGDGETANVSNASNVRSFQGPSPPGEGHVTGTALPVLPYQDAQGLHPKPYNLNLNPKP